MKKLLFNLFFILCLSMYAQIDTTKYPWPLNPMNVQREITGTFGEYRSTSVEGHYHNGTDIPGAAGTPVLNLIAGTVAVAYHDGSTGYDSYVRVTSIINGQPKNMTYYHCIPTVTVGKIVNVGEQIAKIAIDHVHLIDYNLGSSLTNRQLNALRPNGGLTPYSDTWKPKIRYIKFLLDNSNTGLNAGALGNKIDVIVHIEEANGFSSSASNNGAYSLGYKILSADRTSVIYNPPDDGLRYRYIKKPDDSYVNVNYYKPESNTSQHVYILTNGNGANAVENTQVVTNNFWDVTQYPYGNYTLMVFTIDSRGNSDTAYVNITTTELDLTPPAQPNLKFVKKLEDGKFIIAWNKPTDEDLKGFRLFYSQTGGTYNLRDNESVLTYNVTEKEYQYTQQLPLYLKINAVDNSNMTNISIESDSYGVRMKNDGKKILIVDGFNRYGGSGSWSKSFHDFIVKYGESFTFSFESAHNSQVENGTINLNDYEVVIWLLGDEALDYETFSELEKNHVKEYLKNGGKLFVSGSEIAYDLEGDPNSTLSDKDFLHNFLKTKFISNSSNYKIALGMQQTLFEGLNIPFGNTSAGSPYNEDSPDAIDTLNGSIPILKYGNGMTASIAFTGNFDNSINNGQLIVLAFPFETIGNIELRKNFINSVFSYFGLITNVEDEYYDIISDYKLMQNYPNPFNPATKITFYIPSDSHVFIKVFDILGKEIATLVNDNLSAGKHEIDFNASKLSSGIYFYTLNAGSFVSSKKMVLIK
jgi:hypothetical protein